jgi:ribosome-binding factor A
MNFRSDRVAQLIQKELSQLLIREVEFGAALATITRVEVDSHLELARVYVAILPDEKKEEAFELLEASSGRLHHLLSRILNIRPMPKIRFEYDTGAFSSSSR